MESVVALLEMRISVVIPVHEDRLEVCELASRLELQKCDELIVVDASCCDPVQRDDLPGGAKLMHSTGINRAHQQNLGAGKAQGEILLFLHADMTLPVGSLVRLRESMMDEGVAGGGFLRYFDSPSKFLRWTCRLAALRSGLLGWFLGDQALFVRREAFERVGGFRLLVAFEDFDLCRRLKRLGRLRALTPPVISSARRFAAGEVRRSLQDFLLVLRYCLQGEKPFRWIRTEEMKKEWEPPGSDAGMENAAGEVETREVATSVDTFDRVLDQEGVSLQRIFPEVLQINVGKLCNLTCIHCHVDAGPKRREIMTRETVEGILKWLDGPGAEVGTVDLTGGAPEMIPDFRYLVTEVKNRGRHVVDRCNLTILLESGYEDLAEFLQGHEVEIVASMPCYEPDNVEQQRGEGVFDASIKALQLLNHLGYGREDSLPLHLVYNPNGAFLPGDQSELEAAYKEQLRKVFGIEFHRLYTITNLPIARFAAWLRHNNGFEDYMGVLRDAFNPSAVEGLMCRNTISVGWRGEVYDCDFNQQLGMQLSNGKPLFLRDLDLTEFAELKILTAEHCFGCTAGAGSSCGGALV